MMAQFNVSYNKTMKVEGGYVNDPDDPGGETYKGISRRYHPSWKGWQIIDMAKDTPEWPEIGTDNTRILDICCEGFYREQFWDPVAGDYIHEQELADELFDTAVNLHPVRAVTFLQEALNVLNKNGRWYEDIVADGKMGPSTLDTLESYLTASGSDTALLLKIMNILQGNHYITAMKSSPVKEKYARGWINNRVQFS